MDISDVEEASDSSEILVDIYSDVESMPDLEGCPIECGGNSFCDVNRCVCPSGFLNCNNDWSDGCEVTEDLNNCGECNYKCEDHIPENYCLDSKYLREYSGVEKCEEKTCVFTYVDRECAGLCENKSCKSQFLIPFIIEGTRSTSAQSLKILPSGGIIIAGSLSYPDGRTYTQVIRLDNDIQIQWHNIYEAGSGSIVMEIIVTRDGGYVFVGNVDTNNPGKEGLWIVKLDGDGKVLWSKKY